MLADDLAVLLRIIREDRLELRMDRALAAIHHHGDVEQFIELVEETLEKQIEIPERLRSLLSIEKVATKMDASFSEFKKLLMNTLN